MERYMVMMLLIFLLASVYVVLPQKSDVKYDFNCTEPEKCNDAEYCVKAVELLKGTDEDVRKAQMMYCGEHTKATVNSQARHGFGPYKGATGPPLVCCKPEDYMAPGPDDPRCSNFNPNLRLRACGRTPVFFINFAAKAYLEARDVLYRRRHEEPCLTTPRPIIVIDPELLNATEITEMPVDVGKKPLRPSGVRRKRIAGGFPARIGQFPYLAQIYYSEYRVPDSFFGCQATIIHHEMILTTAHCTRKGHMEEVWVGQYDINNITRYVKRYEVINDLKYYLNPKPQRLFIHGTTYNDDYFGAKINRTLINPYDMAIVATRKPMKFNDFVEPICMPVSDAMQESQPPYSGKVYAIGFAFNSEFRGKTLPRFVELEIHPSTYCEDAYRHYYSTYFDWPKEDGESTIVCAGLQHEAEGPCTFDEGTPLLKKSSDGRFYQIGLMMSQLPETCGFKDRPVVYIKMSKFQNWLRNAMEAAVNRTRDLADRLKVPDESKCLTDKEGGYRKRI